MLNPTVQVDWLDYLVRYWVLIAAVVGFIWHSAKLTQIVIQVAETQKAMAEMLQQHESQILVSESKIKNLEREAFKGAGR